MPKTFIYVLSFMMLCSLPTSFAQTASKRALVGNVKRSGIEGCGCYFRFRGTSGDVEQYMFVENIEENDKTAWMNIEGRDVQLKLVKERNPGGREVVGSKWTRTFAANNIVASSTYIATRVCDRDDESCESTDYSATFVIKKGRRVQTVKALGTCGC
jgi:hypothetical protein